MSKNIFVLIDANALIHRGYHAIPHLTTSSGIPTNAAYGFTMMLLNAINQLQPTYIAAAYDLPKPTFRHIQYQQYKAHRKKSDDELIEQIPLTKEILKGLNIPIYEQEGLEADDIIGIIAKQTKSNHTPVIIVTGDMDALQLVDESTKVFTLRRGIKDTVLYNPKTVKQRFGFNPKQIIDYKALRGDPSDNIPGVKGIGEKTATILIQKFKNIENIYQFLSDNPDTTEFKPAVKKNLLENKDMALLSKQLATIITDQPLPNFDIQNCIVKEYNQQKAIDLFQKLEFKSLIDRLPVSTKPSQNTLFTNPNQNTSPNSTSTFNSEILTTPKNKKYHLINTIDKLKKLVPKLQNGFTFDTETSDLDLLNQTKLVGISISIKKDEAYYLPLAHETDETQLPKKDALSIIGPIFANPQIPKFGHNLKFDIQALLLENITTQGIAFDTMIASYLLNPNSANTHNLDYLAFNHLGHRMIPITLLIGEKKSTQVSFAKVNLKNANIYACEDADYTHQLYQKFSAELKNKNLEKIFTHIEMPLIEVLVHIEQSGFLLDTNYFSQFNHIITAKIQNIVKKIQKIAGADFNISSTQQLSEILFHKLHISTNKIKKTKTGLSTAASELDKLKNEHPIIPLIQDYRLYTKLKNTYVDTLPKLVKADGRIHASFNQTITATGRLSSSNPNLQNIPVKSQIGREIRQGFIAPPQHQILAIDYSQIELRIMAHIAQEPTMTKAFNSNQDIHLSTASIIYNKPLAKITETERNNAKTINFSIIYGAGPRNIAGQLNISFAEAQEFIDQYFQKFPQIKSYMEKAITYTREHGYTKTLYDRIRPVPEINSRTQQIKSQAERIAINTPIQGTAADIMKLAMVKTFFDIRKHNLQTKIISQVHDELIFEVPDEEVKQATHMFKNSMESIAKLSVPLKVDLEIGPNWGEMVKIKNQTNRKLL
mgnify:CR=1 FL=1